MAPLFAVENLVRFFDYVRINGYLHIPGRVITKLTVMRSGQPIALGEVNLPRPGSDLPCGFLVTFISPDYDAKQLNLVFDLDHGQQFQVSGAQAAEIFLLTQAARNTAEKQFFERLRTPGYDRVLEVGSRARSGVIRKGQFEGKQYVGIDVLSGPNVDVVGDAHNLSSYFAPESFDAVYSISTFEHLAMPWKVALELNTVLRTGGVAYFHTHQALGMHDMPWDFWRFSDTAWDALFNCFTGFRKVETFLGDPLSLVPTVYHDHWKGYEGSIGFGASAVMIEKTGPCTLRWDLDVAKAIQGIYPA